MSNISTGGPAFPSSGIVTTDGILYEGMTLRDYFAAKAMQTYMINEIWNPDTYKKASTTAYRIADAMIKAREK